MEQLLVLFTFLGDVPNTDVQWHNAGTMTREAMLKDPTIKKEVDDTAAGAERGFIRTTGIKKESLIYLAYAAPLVTQKVSTEGIQDLNYDAFWGFKVRPQVTYTFRDSNTTSLLVLSKGF